MKRSRISSSPTIYQITTYHCQLNGIEHGHPHSPPPHLLSIYMSLLADKYSHDLYHDPHSNSYGTYYEPHFVYEKIERGESSKVTELVNVTVELKFISA